MNLKSRNLLILLLLASCWGPSFLFIKVAVAEVPPSILAGVRIGIGALILNIFLLVKGERLPRSWKFWLRSFVAGLIAQVIPFVLINWGQQFVDSSLASLLNGMLPLFTIILAHFIFHDERLTRSKLTGVFLGFTGLFILVFPNIIGGVTGSVVGIAAISLATISYAFGLIFIRKHFAEAKPMHAPAAQLLMDSIYLIPLSFYFEPNFSFYEVSWQAFGSIAVLGIFGTAIAFILYFSLISRAGAGYASIVTFLMPIYGVILGSIFLQEEITRWMIWGAILILVGIWLVTKNPTFHSRKFGWNVDRRLYSRFR